MNSCSHISEHLQELKDAVNVSAMTNEELEFHYFKCVFTFSLFVCILCNIGAIYLARSAAHSGYTLWFVLYCFFSLYLTRAACLPRGLYDLHKIFTIW